MCTIVYIMLLIAVLFIITVTGKNHDVAISGNVTQIFRRMR
jgi:hypothetical protein